MKSLLLASAFALVASSALAQGLPDEDPVVETLPAQRYVRCYMPVFGFLPNCEATPSLGGGGGAKPDLTAYRGPDEEIDCPEVEMTPRARPSSFVSQNPYECATCFRPTIIIHHPDGTVGVSPVKGKGITVVHDTYQKAGRRGVSTASNGNRGSNGNGSQKK